MSIMQCGMSIGGIICGLIAGPVMASIGWRYLFWFAAIPGLLVFIYIALSVNESPIWLESKKLGKELKEKKEKVSFAKEGYVGSLIFGLVFIAFIMLAMWPVSNFSTAYYATPVEKGGLGIGTALSTQMAVPMLIGALLGYLTFGFVSDKVGRKNTFLFYLAAAGVFCPLQYVCITNHFYVGFMITTVLAGYFGTGLYSGIGVMLSELFPTKFRGTAIGFCYNGGRAIGALGILLAGALIPAFGYYHVIIAFCLIMWVAFISAFFIKDKTGVKFNA